MAFNGSRVVTGPGTLYAAPLGTTEPTSVTGAWPTGWLELGFTDTGSEWTFKPTVQDVEVEESYWPVRKLVTKIDSSLTFALAETTEQNVALALNAGIGTSLNIATEGTNPDGSLWVEPPSIGTEVHVMLGWDALPTGATTGANALGRLVVRQCIQIGQIKRTAAKGNKKATWMCEFGLELPTTGLEPFRWLVPAVLAS